MCGSSTEQRKTRLRCSLCEVSLCKHKDSDGITCWQAWHAAAGDDLRESSKRRSDWLKEERHAKRDVKRQRIVEEAAAAEMQQRFWTTSAAEASTGEGEASEGEASEGEGEV